MASGLVADRAEPGVEMLDETGKVASDLLEFVSEAQRMGIYPGNTAYGLKAAIRRVAPVLTEQEASSLETFKSHLEAIFQRAFNLSKGKVNARSLAVYQRRLLRLINEYEQYGQTPQAMSGWKRKGKVSVGVRSERRIVSQSRIGSAELDAADDAKSSPSMHRLEVSLRPGVRAVLMLPFDLTEDEAKRIKTMIDASVIG